MQYITVGCNCTNVAFLLVTLYKRDVSYPNKDNALGFHNTNLPDHCKIPRCVLQETRILYIYAEIQVIESKNTF